MTITLLDTNVLLALAWPNHEHHLAACKWLAEHPSDQWATCPMTQCGFVRISSNPAIIAEAVTPREAVALLARMMNDPRHIFWEDQVTIADAAFVPLPSLRGHRQVTDAYLFGLCLSRSQQLATFDQGILSLARDDKARKAIIVIPT